ncbi:fumarylacetoacetate hydrolase family protein [Pseudorhodoplanes sinuspersici]|uniref:Gentisate 1,2-dioxygenase n=1 Tax=Pseudorhodoplanes sinuspersici TaxID=1235591 RepID=A0A1W6ZX01_9HYPH|nr:fumarylacetoacetate hydrolase family protein [Pseudorhodoplanes sinuspersici]ARQ01285.1 gentisate 1,2-dioxygenase [Pseudorhodoplanes sinuspersici]RKE72964.1 2-keto-4-pentenoate hydratase/2-oxohepta-3-ene-1,7-dioic acid hydratase in catechol pathway [Pseudorhodoplanes sinuspersici]
MKLVTYEREGQRRLGVIVADSVVDLPDLAAAAGKTCPQDMLSFIQQSPGALELAKALLTKADLMARSSIPLSQTKLLAPLPQTPKGVIGVGLNYVAHVAESSRTMETQKDVPSHPVIFIKPSTSIVGPEEAIVHDAQLTKMLDWEAELGAVIGRRCRNVSETEAMDYVFGYTCVNDVSARDLRHGGQWCFAKGQDTYAPMGPWIVTADEIADAHDLDISLVLNGVEKQKSNTRHMIFNIPKLIAHLSSGITLEPGDVIATGTPEGVGISRTPPEFMKAGDVVEVVIESVGTLRNHVIAA